MSDKKNLIRIDILTSEKRMACFRLEKKIYETFGITFDTGQKIGSGKRDWFLDTLSDEDYETVMIQLNATFLTYETPI